MWARLTEIAGSPAWKPFQWRYRVLRRLLATNSQMLEQIADLEAHLRHLDPADRWVRRRVQRLLDDALLLAENLNILTRDRHRALYEAHESIERQIRELLGPTTPPDVRRLVVSLHAACRAREREVGGKAARLGELRVVMPEHVPRGFVVPTAGYRLFLEESGLQEPVRKLMLDLSLAPEGSAILTERAAGLRKLIMESPVPRSLVEAIVDGVMQFSLPWPGLWAVRSSGVGEDGRLSFAGQYESYLNVTTDRLREAYRDVLASRFTERALLYRLAGGVSEVDTPMAVLFLPMVEARCAGVLYTRDPREENADRMVISSVRGLADQLVRGRAAAETYAVRRSRPGGTAERPTERASGRPGSGTFLSAEENRLLASTGLRVEEYFGCPQEIEWVLDGTGGLFVVQARPLRVTDHRLHGGQVVETRPPLFEGGFTVFPGRAVGPAHPARGPSDLTGVPEGAVAVLLHALPDIAPVLPVLSGVVAEHGSPGSHAATLIREAGVPALFGVEGIVERVHSGQVLSLDATRRTIYEGALWPEVGEQARARIAQKRSGRTPGPVHDLLFKLNLIDPLSAAFRAGNCRSVHDIVRYTHEQTVQAMFDLGDDAVQHGPRRVWRLATKVPMNLTVMDLGGAVGESASERKSITPEEVSSIPFRALWEGMTRPGLSWAGRSQVNVKGMASVMMTAMMDPKAGMRRLGDTNYLVVAPEYLSLNARLAFHFTLIDALVSDFAENNYVNFRFRGGGAGPERRDLRARFLATVLLRSNFGVDRRGDLVTAWLRRYPRSLCEEGLGLLGALLACARQLDMQLDNDEQAAELAERFLDGDYEGFA